MSVKGDSTLANVTDLDLMVRLNGNFSCSVDAYGLLPSRHDLKSFTNIGLFYINDILIYKMLLYSLYLWEE